MIDMSCSISFLQRIAESLVATGTKMFDAEHIFFIRNHDKNVLPLKARLSSDSETDLTFRQLHGRSITQEFRAFWFGR